MKNPSGQKQRERQRLASLFLVGGICAILLAGCSEPWDSKQTSTQFETFEPTIPQATGEKQEHTDKEDAAAQLVLSDEEIQRAGVEVQELALREKADQILVTAVIRANQDRFAHVAPRVLGRIVDVDANLGDTVKAGQTLAALDSIELGEARSSYLQAVSEAAVAQAGFERAKRLQAENIIPEKEFLRARAEQEKAQASSRAAADKLRMLGVDPGKLSGSVFSMIAPFAGTIIEKKAVLGELAPPDQYLFTIADLSVLWIEANLFEKDLAKVALGAQASVTVSAYPDDVFKGRLTYISSVMDKDSRTVKARVEVPNPDGRLKPEMFATAAIHTGSNAKALMVPADAVLLVQGQPTVFVADENGFEPRPVELGERAQGRVVIRSGAEAGESVVVSGGYALKARLLKSQIGDAD